MSSTLLPPTTSPPSFSLEFKLGDLVQVASRTWPGMNKPGGCGKVTGVHNEDGTYDVMYILGGRERVAHEYVRCGSLESGQRKSKERDFFSNYQQLPRMLLLEQQAAMGGKREDGEEEEEDVESSMGVKKSTKKAIILGNAVSASKMKRKARQESISGGEDVLDGEEAEEESKDAKRGGGGLVNLSRKRIAAISPPRAQRRSKSTPRDDEVSLAAVVTRRENIVEEEINQELERKREEEEEVVRTAERNAKRAKKEAERQVKLVEAQQREVERMQAEVERMRAEEEHKRMVAQVEELRIKAEAEKKEQHRELARKKREEKHAAAAVAAAIAATAAAATPPPPITTTAVTTAPLWTCPRDSHMKISQIQAQIVDTGPIPRIATFPAAAAVNPVDEIVSPLATERALFLKRVTIEHNRLRDAYLNQVDMEMAKINATKGKMGKIALSPFEMALFSVDPQWRPFSVASSSSQPKNLTLICKEAEEKYSRIRDMMLARQRSEAVVLREIQKRSVVGSGHDDVPLVHVEFPYDLSSAVYM